MDGSYVTVCQCGYDTDAEALKYIWRGIFHAFFDLVFSRQMYLHYRNTEKQNE